MHLGGERRCESSVLPKNTTLEPRPLAPESSTLTRWLEGLVFINKFKPLKVFANCETVDHSSDDVQQTPPLTKIKIF